MMFSTDPQATSQKEDDFKESRVNTPSLSVYLSTVDPFTIRNTSTVSMEPYPIEEKGSHKLQFFVTCNTMGHAKMIFATLFRNTLNTYW